VLRVFEYMFYLWQGEEGSWGFTWLQKDQYLYEVIDIISAHQYFQMSLFLVYMRESGIGCTSAQ
jgi:hypothetical protein